MKTSQLDRPKLILGWRTPAVIAGACTLAYLPQDGRDWTMTYKHGRDVQAYSHAPSLGGRTVAVLTIEDCELLPREDIPQKDYKESGFDWLYRSGLRHLETSVGLMDLSEDGFRAWRMSDLPEYDRVWAVYFLVKSLSINVREYRSEETARQMIRPFIHPTLGLIEAEQLTFLHGRLDAKTGQRIP